MKTMSNFVLILLIGSFIIGHLFSIPLTANVYSILTAIVIGISIVYSKGLSKVFGISMVVIGSFILFYQHEPFSVWSEGITKNLPLVCLIVIVPILGIPIGLGNYHQQLAGFTAKFNKKPQVLYLFITGLFTLIGPITNMGVNIYTVNNKKLALEYEKMGVDGLITNDPLILR